MKMEEKEAREFFGELFGGTHNIPAKIHPYGDGWSINVLMDFATYDFDRMTRLVFLAHDQCVRASICGSGPRMIKICIWKRKERPAPNVLFCERHPTIEQALALWRRAHPVEASENDAIAGAGG